MNLWSDAFWLFLLSGIIAVPAVLTGGASFLTIPLLMHFGLEPRVAVATNKPGIFTMMLNGVVGFRRYYREMPWVYRLMPALIFLGSWVGAGLLRYLPVVWVKTLVLLLALAAALPWRWSAFFKRRNANAGVRARTTAARPFLVWTLGFIIAVYNGVLGPGTLTLFISLFRYRVGVSIRAAIGWGNLMGVVGNAAAMFHFILLGLVQPRAALAMMAGMFVGAQAGIRLGHRLPGRVLEWFLRVVLLVLVAGLVLRNAVG